MYNLRKEGKKLTSEQMVLSGNHGGSIFHLIFRKWLAQDDWEDGFIK
jgi:hypothetical protein